MRTAALVSCQWLRRTLTMANKDVNKPVKVLDSSWAMTKSGHPDFVSKHIPSAVFFDLNKCVTPLKTLPRNLPDAACFSRYVRSLGLSQNSHIVVYDRGAMVAAAKAWWTFRVFGHNHVSVLDGGLSQWESEGFPTQAGEDNMEVAEGDFEPSVRRELMRTFEDMIENLETKSAQVIDARNPSNFSGEESEPTKFTKKAFEGVGLIPPQPGSMRGGHIPGAVNLSDDDLIDKVTKCMLSPCELEEVFREKGIDLSHPVTTMCYNGNAASLIALATNHCGKTDTSVYYGSWTEFGLRAEEQHVSTTKDSSNQKAGG